MNPCSWTSLLQPNETQLMRWKIVFYNSGHLWIFLLIFCIGSQTWYWSKTHFFISKIFCIDKHKGRHLKSLWYCENLRRHSIKTCSLSFFRICCITSTIASRFPLVPFNPSCQIPLRAPIKRQAAKLISSVKRNRKTAAPTSCFCFMLTAAAQIVVYYSAAVLPKVATDRWSYLETTVTLKRTCTTAAMYYMH